MPTAEYPRCTAYCNGQNPCRHNRYDRSVEQAVETLLRACPWLLSAKYRVEPRHA